MTMQQKSFLALALAVAIMLPAAGMAQVRPIGQATTIDRPGSYILNQDIRLNASRPVGIKIMASGVKLDLNGYEIMGPGGKFGTGVMIEGAEGVEVTNGSMSYLAFGVIVHTSHNVKVNNLRIRGMGLPIVELPPETGVMIYQSRNVVVENNSTYNTGLGVFVRGGQSWGNRITNNTITAGTNPAIGICFNPAETDPTGPRGNLVGDNIISGFGIGIQMKDVAVYNIIRDNSIAYGSIALDLLNDTNVVENNLTVELQ
jgi:nitrous oxidase accessory protein NosD